MTRKQPEKEAERRREQGVLFGSGLVGGGGLTGVLLAAWVGISGGEKITGFPLGLGPVGTQVVALVAIAGIAALTMYFAKKRLE
ncbi:MAG: hypothetical protein SX243_12740 [Acidobacteriota bacterium]|nr:hypothetical protein [Acidobacteriota bacterium]